MKKNQTPLTIERIIKLMELRGITKSKLARGLGVSRSAISYLLEKRIKELSINEIEDISAVLKCKPTDIIADYKNEIDKNYYDNILKFQNKFAINTPPNQKGIRVKAVRLQDIHKNSLKENVDMENTNRIRNKEIIQFELEEFTCENDLMAPEFKKGDRMIINKNIKPNVGDYGIIRSLSMENNIFGQIFWDDESTLRIEFAGSVHPMKLDVKDIMLVGKLVQVIRDFN